MDQAYRRLNHAALGVALGALAMLLGDLLGAFYIAGVHRLLTAAVVAMVLGVAVAAVGYVRWLLWLDLALIAVALAAVSPLFVAPINRWVRNDDLGRLQGHPADAIVVLSTAIKSDSAIDATAADRLLTGLGLFQEGYGQRIITTRVAKRMRGRIVTTDSDQARLVRLAGADTAWTVAGLTVASTRDEALWTRRLFPAGAGTIILVTSPMHTRRACATFEAVGFTVVCRAAREREYVTWPASIPEDRLAAFKEYFYERLGMIDYLYRQWAVEPSRPSPPAHP